MTYDVDVKIYSVIKSEGEEPSVSTARAVGKWEVRANSDFILSYSEKTEWGEQHTRLSYDGSCATLSLAGPSCATLRFEGGAEYETVYKIGGFEFDAAVKSGAPTARVSDSGGEIKLGYQMTLGGDSRVAKILISFTKKD